MEKGYYSLEIRDDDRLTRIFKILMGIICFAIAIFWIIYSIRSVKVNGKLWITTAFLLCFGLFQIYSGIGLAVKFIELTVSNIRLKKNSLLPAVDLPADKFEKIELFPLKVHFIINHGKRILLRFGISDPDKIELIKAEIVRFADRNNLSFEIKTEEI